MALWRALRKRRFMQMDSAVGHRKTNAKKAFCLAEGIRRINRKFLASATSISLNQDASNSRMLARYTATNDRLMTRSGVLGMVRDYGSGHKANLEATKRLIEEFSTPLLHAPPRADPRDGRMHLAPLPPTCNNHLAQHIMNTIEIWNTDAAQDEVLAGQEAHVRGPAAAHIRPLLPALRFVNRDRCHASRRHQHE